MRLLKNLGVIALEYGVENNLLRVHPCAIGGEKDMRLSECDSPLHLSRPIRREPDPEDVPVFGQWSGTPHETLDSHSRLMDDHFIWIIPYNK